MGLTQRRDAVELSLVHEQVHVDGARVELFCPQEIEDGGKERGVPVNEDLRREKGQVTWQQVSSRAKAQDHNSPLQFHPSGRRCAHSKD